ncbi:uncharacterized protein LOC129610467 [Condylostylus longicornis]|uniref:uncharacterized protein LOC129610467 n=1 Tax=Condylostylus longicornis TaxID=2530218 RepID=UPI00244E211D|nr:uncharacterized protein LOC129610467 [Condylostylus longicornis]
MKITYLIILFGLTVILDISDACKSNSVSVSGGTVVKTIGGTIYCGMLICPKSAVNCKVTSKNDPKNAKIIEINEICSDFYGSILDQNTYRHDNPSGSLVDSETGVGPQYNARARQQTAIIKENINRNIQNLPVFLGTRPRIPTI